MAVADTVAVDMVAADKTAVDTVGTVVADIAEGFADSVGLVDNYS